MRALDALTRTLGPAVDAGWDQVGDTDCPACHGEGYGESLVYGRGAGPEGLEPIYEQYECDQCTGSGRAPVVVFTIRPAEPLVDAPKPPIPPGGEEDADFDWPF